MTCTKHSLRMVRLVLRGRVETPEHAALLADVRRCRRCHAETPPDAPVAIEPEAFHVPPVRVEDFWRQLEEARR